MIHYLTSDKLTKKINKHSNKKVSFQKKEQEIVDDFYNEVSAKTITEAFNKINQNGHPPDIKLAEELSNKYKNRRLEFDDIKIIIDLYKSNSSKGEK